MTLYNSSLTVIEPSALLLNNNKIIKPTYNHTNEFFKWIKYLTEIHKKYSGFIFPSDYVTDEKGNLFGIIKPYIQNEDNINELDTINLYANALKFETEFSKIKKDNITPKFICFNNLTYNNQNLFIMNTEEFIKGNNFDNNKLFNEYIYNILLCLFQKIAVTIPEKKLLYNYINNQKENKYCIDFIYDEIIKHKTIENYTNYKIKKLERK